MTDKLWRGVTSDLEPSRPKSVVELPLHPLPAPGASWGLTLGESKMPLDIFLFSRGPGPDRSALPNETLATI